MLISLGLLLICDQIISVIVCRVKSNKACSLPEKTATWNLSPVVTSENCLLSYFFFKKGVGMKPRLGVRMTISKGVSSFTKRLKQWV